MADFKSSSTVTKSLNFGPQICHLRWNDRNCPKFENFEGYVTLPLQKNVLVLHHTHSIKINSQQQKIKLFIEVKLNTSNQLKELSFSSDQAIIARINRLIVECDKNKEYPKKNLSTN